MTKPRFLDSESVASAATALQDMKSKKRSFEESQFFDKTTTSPENFCYSRSLKLCSHQSKRAKTAPSSPIAYAPPTKVLFPVTPNMKCPELPITPPSIINQGSTIAFNSFKTNPITAQAPTTGASNSFSELSAASSASQSPATPPPSVDSSPRGFPKIMKLGRKPLTTIPESAYFYPDTCYSFSLLNTSANIPDRNRRASFLEHQNQEWRDYYKNEISHSNARLYKKYRSYCEGLKMTESAVTKMKNTGSSNYRSLLPTASKLTTFVDSQYNRYDGLVNYPYASNYRYQSTGYLHDAEVLTRSPELYGQHSAKGYFASGDYQSQEPRGYKLPPLSQVLKMPHETIPPLAYSPENMPMAVRPRINISSQASSPTRHVSKFINTSLTSPKSSGSMPTDTTTTTTIITSPTGSSTSRRSSSSHRRHSHSTYSHRIQRRCISCHSTQSPCWRPSWDPEKGQLCNSCGLRYKKTKARCMNPNCLRIPAKGEWTLMKNRGKILLPVYNDDGDEINKHHTYKCLHCDGEVAVEE
ncbi:hypothetical protein FOA43_003459 [Brettanomyces nanus]|uniref:GATA-type domain-containing protein n=1 Tax=Eeniella nana TaxID=13502 RepID=A0A875S575_EENNA|nr:uncharacterized protein FOA43_003459 [Brettanomyces nanus]QPG76073.1 hypothetical protein FOA43_003459 [Brettanomyces nanus]